MKKQLLAMLAGVALASGGAVGAAFAGNGPDANGPAKHGLCTAYHNGSANGQANKRKAQPFVNLEQAAKEADEADGEDNYTTTADEVAAFCAGLIGGRAGNGKPTPGGGNAKA
ncbi:MAG TPA: hypothetical protein VNA57_12230 [Acidimicrobiales bacterium]|nr:hypothetical protein [Acidimicrobiales bacterium]